MHPLYLQLEQRYYECFPDQRQTVAGTQNASEQSAGERKQSATSKTSLQMYTNNSGSSHKKTQPTSHDKSSINNSGRPRLHLDIDTPDKDIFEFGGTAAVVLKSNDKLSS